LSDHPRGAAIVCGALATAGCLLMGKRNAPIVLVVPFGVLVGFAVYFMCEVRRRAWAGRLCIAQLLVALVVCVLVIFGTLARGGQSPGEPSGLEYWITHNPGYYLNPRWAMQDLWIAGIAAGWFLVVAGWVRWRNGVRQRIDRSET
jgi:hypothetical protein